MLRISLHLLSWFQGAVAFSDIFTGTNYFNAETAFSSDSLSPSLLGLVASFLLSSTKVLDPPQRLFTTAKRY